MYQGTSQRLCAHYRLHHQGRQTVNYLWEILRYVAAWGGTGLIIWFWYWLFSNIGTF